MVRLSSLPASFVTSRGSPECCGLPLKVGRRKEQRAFLAVSVRQGRVSHECGVGFEEGTGYCRAYPGVLSRQGRPGVLPQVAWDLRRSRSEVEDPFAGTAINATRLLGREPTL